MSSSLLLFILSLILLCLTIVSTDAANILCLFTSPGQSHMIINMAIATTLVNRGHNLTIVTTMPLKDKNPKYNHIFIPPSKEDYAAYNRLLEVAASKPNKWASYMLLFWANVERVRLQDKAIKSPKFQEFLDNPGNSFDVMILGWVFNTYQLGVAAHFKCPVIVSFINQPFKLLLNLVGSPLSISSVPAMTSFYDLKSFKGRLTNVFDFLIYDGFDKFGDYKMGQYYEEQFPADRYPSYEEMKKNVSLVFCASHFSEGRIRPLTPGFVEIGGIQVKENPDPLPKDIAEFLDSAHEGFILFSLGTNIKSTFIPKNVTSAMFNVLSQSKYKILWKWDTSDVLGESPNILFRQWLPQDDLLSHPKLKLFITHAGKGSSVEAQYHGIPMLTIPIYGDQPGNAMALAAKGYGLIVNYRNLTEQSFRRDFNEMLENPKYFNSVKRFSRIYRDRPLSPKDSVVYWTEYVIRHRGAKHMQSPVVHLNFFQRNSLDVLGFLGLILFLSYVIVRKMFKLICFLILKLCYDKLKTD